jgi:tRNA modification GTPase
MYADDTIVAPATASGRAAVAIVRLSGPRAIEIARSLWKPLGDHSSTPRELFLGEISDPLSGAPIDRAMAVIFPKPRSLTGENVAELHCHGGIYLVRRVIGAALDLGARIAEPGEFTRRAFLNGRIDLTAAEAVADLVDARGEGALAQALGNMAGALAGKIGSLRRGLLNIRVHLEAEIDFSDEDIVLPPRSEMIHSLDILRAGVAALRDSFMRGRLLREGARTAIVGKPNAGKSSILNLLLGIERAIVTPVPGTTRDVVEDSIALGGWPLILQDTAGVRESDDPVEKIGIGRTYERARDADLILAVFDSSRPLDDDDRIVAALAAARPALAILNKSDLPEAADESALRKAGVQAPIIRLSALAGEGLDELRAGLADQIDSFAGGIAKSAEVAISRERHRAALDRAAAALTAAIQGAIDGMPPEIIAIDVNLASDELGAITGEISTEDVLDSLFREFCIGK